MTIRTGLPTTSTPERWGACGILLSMDCMQGLIQPMGLTLEVVRLKHAVREAVIASRLNFEKGNTEPEFPVRLIDSLQSHFGEDAIKQFLSWFSLDFTYSVHDQQSWRRWYSAFSEFSNDLNAWSQLRLPPRSSTQLHEHYDRIMFQADIWGIWGDARSHVLSDWDLEMYAIHKFDDSTKDPFNWVVLTYETHCFRQFWAEVRSTLTEQELNDLWHWLRDDPTSYRQSLPDPMTLSNEGAT